MIAFLKGTVQEIYLNSFILEVHDIGYELLASSQTLDEIQCYQDVRIHTYLHVREDELSLFGFYTKDEMTMFKLLLKVNGVGPKAALAILSALNVSNLRYAILSSDLKALSQAKGIGKKTAERILIELKDQVSTSNFMDDYIGSSCSTSSNALLEQSIRIEVIEALSMLGYSERVATQTVGDIDVNVYSDTETMLKEALKRIK